MNGRILCQVVQCVKFFVNRFSLSNYSAIWHRVRPIKGLTPSRNLLKSGSATLVGGSDVRVVHLSHYL